MIQRQNHTLDSYVPRFECLFDQLEAFLNVRIDDSYE